MQRSPLFRVLLNQHISRFLLRPNDFTITDELSSPLTIICYVQILKGNHLSLVNLTNCLTEYSWVLVSLTPVYMYSCTVYVRIRAAPHCAEFPIKML